MWRVRQYSLDCLHVTDKLSLGHVLASFVFTYLSITPLNLLNTFIFICMAVCGFGTKLILVVELYDLEQLA